MIKKILKLAIPVVLAFPIQSCLADNDYLLNIVAEGIYYHQGIHQDASEGNFGAIANVGFIIGERCVAVVDSGGSFLEGTLLLAAIKRHTDKPVCYVINTHVHPDHTLGNAAFFEHENKPIIIGHEKLPAAMAARKEFFETTFSEILGDAYPGTEFIAPQQTVTVGDPVSIDLGNRELELTAYTTSHTDHDLTVLDKNTRTLWTGDLLFIERIPVVDGSLNGWIANIEKLMQLNVDRVIPGHGPASEGQGQQGWEDQLRYLTTLRDQIRVIVDELGTIQEATETVGIEERDKWELYDQYHRRNVTASFVELEWE